MLQARLGLARLSLFGLLLTGCVRVGERVPIALEGLTFVAAGPCKIADSVDCKTVRPLLVDRFEVTRSAWLEVARGKRDLRLPEVYTAGWDADTARLPATGMTLDQARDFAASRGMRLPTVTEWMRIAAGAGAQRWPWGVVDQKSAANTSDLGLGRLAPVGTFGNGNTSARVSDMLGNAAEWVESPLSNLVGSSPKGPSQVPAVLPSLASGASLGSLAAWAMGGAYTDRQRPLHSSDQKGVRFHARELDPRHRSTTVGLRCVTDAESYLWVKAAEFSSPELYEAVRAVGRTWGVPAAGLLEDLAERPGAPVGLRWLLEGVRGE